MVLKIAEPSSVLRQRSKRGTYDPRCSADIAAWNQTVAVTLLLVLPFELPVTGLPLPLAILTILGSVARQKVLYPTMLSRSATKNGPSPERSTPDRSRSHSKAR